MPRRTFGEKIERASLIEVEPCPHGIADRPCETCHEFAFNASSSFRHLGTILEWRHLPERSARRVVRLHCYTCKVGSALEVLAGVEHAVNGIDPEKLARETVRAKLRKAGCPHKPPPIL
jgi:hypothetical protein